jgi:hypothetical protein
MVVELRGFAGGWSAVIMARVLDQPVVGLRLQHLDRVIVERAETRPDAVWLHARVRADTAACPVCQTESRSVHVRYHRRFRDTAPALLSCVRFDHGLLDAEDGEDVAAVVSVAAGVGDVRASGEAEGIEGQVAETGHSAWSTTCPELGTVLLEGHVPDPMQAVLHAPVPTGVGVEVIRAGPQQHPVFLIPRR